MTGNITMITAIKSLRTGFKKIINLYTDINLIPYEYIDYRVNSR